MARRASPVLATPKASEPWAYNSPVDPLGKSAATMENTRNHRPGQLVFSGRIESPHVMW